MLFIEPIGFKNSCGVKATLENITYYPYHMHDGILEIVCVLDGKYEISNGVHDHTISFGDVFFFNHRDCHRLKRISDKGILLTMYIDLKRYQSRFRDFDGTGSYSLVDDAFFICDAFRHEDKYSIKIKYLRFLLSNIYREYSSKKYSELKLHDMILEFLNHILSHYQNYFYARRRDGKYIIIQDSKTAENDDNSSRMHRIIDYIYANFREKISLEDIAQLEYLNTSYLSTFIRKTSGLTFSDFLSITRCEDAERLLSTTTKTLDEIASEVGFSDRVQLTKQFKKWFNRTPSTYRKELHSDFSEDSNASSDVFDYKFAELIVDSYLDGY